MGDPVMMQIDQQGLLLLERWEGVRYRVYPDPGGAPTIDIGHAQTRSERRSGMIIIEGREVEYAHGITLEQCRALLDQDLKPVVYSVNSLVGVVLTQNQFNALCSFVFNVGIEALALSTLLRLLNEGQFDAVPAQMRRWVYDAGEVMQGLVNRREREVELWNEELK